MRPIDPGRGLGGEARFKPKQRTDLNMDGMILAHAGGLDEMAILLFPFIVGGGVWVLTRQPNAPGKKPKVLTDADPDSGE